MTIDRNRIYNMDCLDGIRDMLRGGVRVDCVITDPPYLINYQTHRRQDKEHKFCKAIQNDDNPQLIIDLVPLLYDVMKDNTRFICFAGAIKSIFSNKKSKSALPSKTLLCGIKATTPRAILARNTANVTSLSFMQTKDAPRFNPICRGWRIYGTFQRWREKNKYTKTKNRQIFCRKLSISTPKKAI